MCGEHRVEDAGVGHVDGSSPRVRGTLERLEAFARAVGIIPACAGNTAHMICLELPTRDHPRVCGEHDPFATTLCASLGSSPRVRGTLEGEWDGGGRSGIIPACAGNTGRPKVSKRNRRDHPRVCGEHNATVRVIPTGRGSSPRVRGTQIMHAHRFAIPGIIPACAGNTRAL